MDDLLTDNSTVPYYETYDETIRGLVEEKLPFLAQWQLNVIENYTHNVGKKCMIDFWELPQPKELHCNATWDTFFCWERTPANTTVYGPCPYLDISVSYPYSVRHCDVNGSWENGDWTDYTMCIQYHSSLNDSSSIDNGFSLSNYHFAKILAYIYFFGGIVSVILLSVTLFIFTYFKTLHCNRISIHKHLVLSFIIRFSLVVVSYEYAITGGIQYRGIKWLCRTMTSMIQYCTMANIFWMFVEGMFLHNRVAISVFNTEAPFRVFYFLGWGLPGLIVTAWSVLMYYKHPPFCWSNYFNLPYIWIIVLPIIIALAINAVFLVNIIRILITKLRANNTMEADQVRKAVRATAVLFPLLGMCNLIFVIKPEGGASEMAYRITNAVLQSSQGIFISVIYCFMNSEVRSAIRKKWQRYKMTRMGHTRGRRASSRTSSLFISSSTEARGGRTKSQFYEFDKCNKIVNPPGAVATELQTRK